MSIRGKTIFELQETGQISDVDQLLLGDVSDPLKAKRVALQTVRIAMGAFLNASDVTENYEIEAPAWTVEGLSGGWRISILSAVDDATAYLVWYYNQETDTWETQFGIVESRGEAGGGASTLTRDVMAPRSDEEDVVIKAYREFKVQTLTATEKSPLSTAKGTWTRIMLPPGFVPSAPILVDDATYPYTSFAASYNNYTHVIMLRINAAEGEAEYISEYELQRRKETPGGNPSPWKTLTKHALVHMTTTPAPRVIIYADDSQSFPPNTYVYYRVRAIDLNGTPSEWSDTINYTVEEDDTAPDVPQLTITQVQLGFKIVFDEPTQNDGDPCPDWRYWTLQCRKDAGSWTYIDGKAGRIEKHDYTFPVQDADLGSTYEFRAKGRDWSENGSAFCEATSPISPKKITEDSVDTTFTQKLAKITTNEGAIAAHETEIKQNASNILLRATETYVDTQDGLKANLTTLISEINVCAEGTKISTSKVGGIDEDDLETTLSVLADGVDIAVKQDGSVISSFELGVSGVQLQGECININGSTTFSSGYDPTDKVAEIGGSYDSAASGARVRIFPDANTGIQVIDNAAADVFKVLVGGADVGDVIIGASAGQHVKWDKSAASLLINGLLAASGGIKTGVGNNRIEIGAFGGSDHDINIYHSNVIQGSLVTSPTGGVYLFLGTAAGYRLFGDKQRLYLTNGSASAYRVKLDADEGGGHINVYDASSNSVFYAGSDEVFTAADLTIDTGKVLKVGTDQVVGARGAAVANAGIIHGAELDETAASLTDCQEMRTQLNAVLARLRSTTGHGLFT